MAKEARAKVAKAKEAKAKVAKAKVAKAKEERAKVAKAKAEKEAKHLTVANAMATTTTMTTADTRDNGTSTDNGGTTNSGETRAMIGTRRNGTTKQPIGNVWKTPSESIIGSKIGMATQRGGSCSAQCAKIGGSLSILTMGTTKQPAAARVATWKVRHLTNASTSSAN